MKVAVVQLTSVLDPSLNLAKLKELLKEAKSQGAQAAFLPECFYSMSNGLSPTPYAIDASDPDCEHLKNIVNLAVETKIDIIGGSAATLVDDKIINRTYSVTASGELLPSYDKIHLFSCKLKDKNINEADIYTPGNSLKHLHVGAFQVGLGICFDIRYSAMAHQYRLRGADILTFSSAFTVPTGKAHWHLLNRARAIENQCYVISSAQWGQNNERISTFGHSLIVDPWGEVLVDLKEGEGVGVAELSREKIQQVRDSVHMRI